MNTPNTELSLLLLFFIDPDPSLVAFSTMMPMETEAIIMTNNGLISQYFSRLR